MILPDWYSMVTRRYGIRTRILGGSRTPPSSGSMAGPPGYGCDPRGRCVIIDQDLYDQTAPEFIFHELVHVIVQPPWTSIENATEDFVLLQFERALAREVFSADRRALGQIILFQEVTQTGATFHELGREPGYRRSGYWRDGFLIARTIGILDRRNRPTWRWPRWNVLPHGEWRRLHSQHQHEDTGVGHALRRSLWDAVVEREASDKERLTVAAKKIAKAKS